MKLVIIEGIGKKQTIEKYLGKGYRVFATGGHIRDLPVHTLGVDVANNYQPNYQIISDKKEVVKKLIEAANESEEILLATDPDREGEAISWHLANILHIPENQKVRIEFNEISKKAIQNALSSPREIDINLVDSQQARRVLDRLVGYKVSPVLCKKIQSKLSAGRVQSVTLRLIVDREREIRAFKPEEYWPFTALLQNSEKAQIKAVLATKKDKKFKIGSQEELNVVLNELDGKSFTVSSVDRSVTKVRPSAPFITSTMQQDALNKLGFSLKLTTSTAQTLYEGVNIEGEGKVALVTYIRTDSTRVSDDAMAEARNFIKEKYGDKYVPSKPNVYTKKKNAQDAHEAIRPITLTRTPESLKGLIPETQYKLYKLIYDRFLASQMSDASYNSLSCQITSGDYGFKVNGKTPLFEGFTAVYKNYSEDKDDDVMSDELPNLSVGEILKLKKFKYEQKFTKPPLRYTEASLVKVMEEKGIGRPATYTPMVTLLFTRDYTKKEGKFIVPTELGEKVCDMLNRYFPDIMDVKFTANMESKLDEIEGGGKVWQNIINDFYQNLLTEIKFAGGDSYTMKAEPLKTDIKCNKCGSYMVIKESKYGKFLACSAYPKCKNTLPIDENNNIIETKTVESTEICPDCGKPLVVKSGKYGNFLACSGYPKCKYTKNIETPNENHGNCPQCGKPLRFVKGKRAFYGCTGYPECNFISNYPVSDVKCPQCGAYQTVRKDKSGQYLLCSNVNCKHKERLNDQN